MKKYFLDCVDTRLRPIIQSMQHEELKILAINLVETLIEINRLEGNRVQRTKNLRGRLVNSKVYNLTQNKLMDLFI